MSVVVEECSEQVIAKVTPKDKCLLERAAELEGASIESFISSHALEIAERIVRQHQPIVLNAEESLRFAEALLRPIRPAPEGFIEADRLYKKHVVQ